MTSRLFSEWCNISSLYIFIKGSRVEVKWAYHWPIWKFFQKWAYCWMWRNKKNTLPCINSIIAVDVIVRLFVSAYYQRTWYTKKGTWCGLMGPCRWWVCIRFNHCRPGQGLFLDFFTVQSVARGANIPRCTGSVQRSGSLYVHRGWRWNVTLVCALVWV